MRKHTHKSSICSTMLAKCNLLSYSILSLVLRTFGLALRGLAMRRLALRCVALRTGSRTMHTHAKRRRTPSTPAHTRLIIGAVVIWLCDREYVLRIFIPLSSKEKHSIIIIIDAWMMLLAPPESSLHCIYGIYVWHAYILGDVSVHTCTHSQMYRVSPCR